MRVRAKRTVKHTVLALCLGLLSVFAVVSCDKLQRLRLDELVEVAEVLKEDSSWWCLRGTTWKLVGIVDVQTSDTTELEPKNCDHCYWFEFYTDSTARGRSASNSLWVSLRPNVRMGLATEVGEAGDGELFHIIIRTIITYGISENELKFYYNDFKNYLLFKKIGG